METIVIKNLTHSSITELVECLLESFKGYFVPMPSDVSFWKARFKHARVDYSLSWGAYDDQKLVAFIIHAVDHQEGQLCAYNTGTGVLPSYRGQGLVDTLYETGMPKLKERGVERCFLEVICENQRAIKVYERIGFERQHRLYCFKGTLAERTDAPTIQKTELSELEARHVKNHYSWDNQFASIKRAGKIHQCYYIMTANEEAMGYFIINPRSGYISQVESFTGDWAPIFNAIGSYFRNFKINNIHSDRIELIQFLQYSGMENTINQYYMTMDM